MQRLQKFVPENAHVLFGAAVDPSMGDSLSLTLISALPEDSLAMAPREVPREAPSHAAVQAEETAPAAAVEVRPADPEPLLEWVEPQAPAAASDPELSLALEVPSSAPAATEPSPASLLSRLRRSLSDGPATPPALFGEAAALTEPGAAPTSQDLPALDPALNDLPLADEPSAPHVAAPEESERPPVAVADFVAMAAMEDPAALDNDPTDTNNETLDDADPEFSGFSPIPKKRPPGITPWSTAKGPRSLAPELEPVETAPPALTPEPDAPKLKLVSKPATPQSELSFDSTPRGRFEGESPNVFDGEDLDLPPFLRKKK